LSGFLLEQPSQVGPNETHIVFGSAPSGALLVMAGGGRLGIDRVLAAWARAHELVAGAKPRTVTVATQRMSWGRDFSVEYHAAESSPTVRQFTVAVHQARRNGAWCLAVAVEKSPIRRLGAIATLHGLREAPRVVIGGGPDVSPGAGPGTALLRVTLGIGTALLLFF
jgi:hypothetical protein